MACRGVHFALTPEDAARIDAARDDDQLMALIEEIEERWDRDWLVETDKAWDATGRVPGAGPGGVRGRVVPEPA
jgi:hypothetical protein